MKRMLSLVVVLLAVLAMLSTTAYATPKEKAQGPVILLLDPLDPEGTILQGVHPNHKSSVIIVERNHKRLGIAVVPGLVSENVVTEPYLNSDGKTYTHRIISMNDGDFKNYVDSAVSDIVKYSSGPEALSASALSKTPMYIVWEADCGTAYCRRVNGEIVDCTCMYQCSGCYYINIFE